MNEEKEKKLNAICDFRYSLIAELCNPYLPVGKLKEMIKEKANREYDIPYSTKRSISEGCIKKWLYLYKKYGKQALLPKERNDCGRSRSISLEDEKVITEYLETHPDVSAINAVKKLASENKIKSEISTSSLYRLLISSGLGRQNRENLNKKEEKQVLKFSFKYPLECVQADCMYSFKMKDEKAKLKPVILIAFIDDATRRILYGKFTFTEKSLMFEQGIKHILKSHGKIQKVYVDNGSTFISNQSKRILNILGIILVHSTVGRPKGRGKIERFFRTVQDQFVRILDKSSIKSIEDLNIKFSTWLETEYHRNPHRGLYGETPLDVWLNKTKYIIPLDKTINLEEVFLHEDRRKVYRDATITLNGILYEVSCVLIGKTIRIYYDPFSPVKILRVYYDGKFYGESAPVDTYANTRVKRNYFTHKIDCIENKKEDENIEENKNNIVKTSLNASKIKIGENNE